MNTLTLPIPRHAPPVRLPNRQNVLKGLGLGVGIAAAIGGYQWWQAASVLEETDDAYIRGHVHQISARVPGIVTAVNFDDNYEIKQGDVLVKLDPATFETRVASARAALNKASQLAESEHDAFQSSYTTADASDIDAETTKAAARADLAASTAAEKEARAALAAAKSVIMQREADVLKASNDLRRTTVLEREGAVSEQDLDAATRDFQVSAAARDAAKEQLQAAQARVQQATEAIAASEAKLRQTAATLARAKSAHEQTSARKNNAEAARASASEAAAALEAASLDLSYTTIRAAVSGKVGAKNVEVGQHINAGQPLLALVEDRKWVVANFKETQLARMKVGQEVELEVDALPHKKLRGKVESFAPGSGAQFALLPPDNATGNFTKIVQRVPVKIELVDAPHDLNARLIPGMSVTAKVHVGQ